jgi:type IV pilus assembly protein PilM
MVALDIGSRQTKVVAASWADGCVAVKAAESSATPPGTVEEQGLNDPARAAALLRDIAEAAGVVGCRAFSAIGGRHVIVRTVTTRPLPREDALDAARIEAAKLLPMPFQEAAIVVQLLPGADAGSEGRWSRALVIAAPKSLVERHAECMELAGLEPAGLDAIQLALLRALKGTPSANLWQGHPWAIVALGASTTELLVAEGGTPAFCRTLAWGTNRLSAAAGRNDAETTARGTEGLGISWEGDVGEDGRILRGEARRSAGLATLAAEIQRSLIYYQMQFPEGSYRGVVGRIVLSGGGAAIPGMREYLERQLDTSVQVGDPLMHLEARVEPQAFRALNAYPTAFAPCLGLIARGDELNGTDPCDEQIN